MKAVSRQPRGITLLEQDSYLAPMVVRERILAPAINPQSNYGADGLFQVRLTHPSRGLSAHGLQSVGFLPARTPEGMQAP